MLYYLRVVFVVSCDDVYWQMMLTVQFQRQHQTRRQQIAGLSGGTSISVVQTISDCRIDRNYWLK